MGRKPKGDSILRGIVKELELSLLDAAGWNPQEMTEQELRRLIEEFKENGQIDPIQVVPLDNGRYRILGGHSRSAAARALGWDRIACVVLTDEKFKDEDLQKFLTVRLNVLHGRLNPEKMASLYRQMAERYGEKPLTTLMGFTDGDALRKLVSGVSNGLKKSGLPEEVVKKFDEASKGAKTGHDLSNILKRLFEDYGSTLDYNFMVFAHGGKKHLYIAADDALWKRLMGLIESCKEEGRDINEVFRELLKDLPEGEEPEGSEDEE